MKWWPFQNTKRRRPVENTRFRHRKGPRDSKLAVNVPRSRREMRKLRRERLLKALRWGGIAAALIAVILVGRAQWRQIFQSNPDFAIGDFEFKTNGGITWKQAAATAGLRRDMNLMDADLAGIREKLMSLPRVKAVSVERRLPGRLAIEIEERLPVARLTSQANSMGADKRMYVDSTGVAFKCEEYLRQHAALPVIDDSALNVVNFGQRVETQTTLAALEVLEKFRARHWPVSCSVSRILIPNPWTLNVEVDPGAVAVFTFNTWALDPQLDRLEFILKKTSERGIAVASVNLQMERNVPVVYDRRVAAAPPAAPAQGTAVPYEPAPQVRTQRVSAPAAPPRRTPAAPRDQRDIDIINRGT